MKKILIIAYFFPPANFVGGDRIAAWAKYLHKLGYFPTIVTRNWNDGQKDLTGRIEDNTLKHDVFETYEVYRLPYKRTLRDKLNSYPNSIIASFLRRFLSFLELFIQNFSMLAIPYANFYDFSLDLIKQGDYKCLIASGRPFQLFSIASKLKKRTGIPWIADYRDEWNTFQNKNNDSFLLGMIHNLEAKSELSWTSNADLFITVSESWKENIQKVIRKNGFVVMNGFDTKPSSASAVLSNDFGKLEISYIGTLYSYQPIEFFIQSMKELILRSKNGIKIKVNFIGLNIMPEQEQRVSNLIKGFEDYFFLYDRMPKIEMQQFYENADFLLATSFDEIKGWYPVKIFEYAASGKPILLCPSDNDVLANFVKETNTGVSFNKTSELIDFLSKVILKKTKNEMFELKLNLNSLETYSRENQTKELALILDKF